MMKQIRFKLVAALFAVAVIAIFVTTISQMLLSQSFIDEAVERESNQLSQRFNDQIEAYKLQVLSLSKIVALQPSVIEAFESADRETLIKEFSMAFGVLKKDFGMGQFQFHLPPATSFLRVHKIKKFGDDLSSFRKTVVAVNTTKATVSGIEVGRAGLGIRGVTPIFNGKKHLGSIEFGLSLKKKFIDQFASSTGTQVAVFLTNKTNIKPLTSGAQAQEAGIKPLASNIKLNLPLTVSELAQANTQQFMLQRDILDANHLKGIVFPIKDYSNKPIAAAVVLFDITKLNAILDKSYLYMAGVLILLLMAFGALAIWTWKSVLTPLVSMKASMLTLANGNTDIDLQYAVREDEIGEMARAVSVFKDNQIEKSRLDEEAEIESKKQAQRQVNIDALISEFNTKSEQTLQTVSENAEQMEITAQALTQSASSSSDQANRANDATSDATNNVQAVAGAAQEMRAAIHEISTQISQTSNLIADATEAAQHSDVKVASLSNAAQRIGDVIALIQDIAEQTNLLALNATIEAARAGDSGKGFAVVASEVKSLASQTAKATEEISIQINAIQTETEEAVKSIKAIAEKMGDVNTNTTIISAAIEEQSASTTEIASNINAAADGNNEVVKNVSSVSEAIQETSVSAGQVLSLSRNVKQQAESMQHVVSDFLQKVAQV